MRRRSTAMVLALALASGCGTKADVGRAESVVRAALEVWKGGGTPQQLADQAIDIAEPDWKAGYRLLDFRVKNVSEQPQQGPRVVAVLTLQGRAGKAVTKEVAYEVMFKGPTKASIGQPRAAMNGRCGSQTSSTQPMSRPTWSTTITG